jgi:hypothetical protein
MLGDSLRLMLGDSLHLMLGDSLHLALRGSRGAGPAIEEQVPAPSCAGGAAVDSEGRRPHQVPQNGRTAPQRAAEVGRKGPLTACASTGQHVRRNTQDT